MRKSQPTITVTPVEWGNLILEAQANAWDAAIHHVQPFLTATEKRAAMRDNPYRMAS